MATELFLSYAEALQHCPDPFNQDFTGLGRRYFCEPLTSAQQRYGSDPVAASQQDFLLDLAKTTGQTVTYVPPDAQQYGYLAGLRVGECGPNEIARGAYCAKPIGFGSFNLGEYLGDVGAAIATGVAFTASFTTGLGAAYTFSKTVLDANEVRPMGLDLGGIFGGVANVVGGLSSGNYLSALQGGLGIASAAFAPSPQAAPVYGIMPSYGPVYSPPAAPAPAPQPAAQPVGAFGMAARAVATVTAPILTKIAVKLGLRARPSLTRAMEMVRKAAKLLQSPEAVAAALGITVAELASLITASNARKRRRMNPANSKALRRAARRIKSFHKLCTHTDVLRGRGRGASRRIACGSCKKSPCRC